MNLVGQCPSCHTQCEVDPEDVGYALECECGVDLFACSVSGFEQIKVACQECGNVHSAEREAAGETVACECGIRLTVPTIVLRAPVSVSQSKVTSIKPESKAKSSKLKRSPSIACPDCGKEYDVARADLDQECQCDCGCIFRISIEENGNDGRKLVARVSPVVVASQPDGGKPAGDSDDRDGASPDRRKQRSWFAILGTASVVSFLLISVIIFLNRSTGNRPDPASDSTVASYAASSQTEMYSPDALRDAIAKLGVDSSADDEGLLSAELTRSNTADSSGASSRQSGSQSTGGREPSATLKLPPLAERPLPEPTSQRDRIPLSPVAEKGLTFAKAYEVAFADFRETRDAKKSADASNDADALAEFQMRIGRTLGLLQLTHDVGMQVRPDEEFTEEEKRKKLSELRYFLTWAYFHAGWLPEATIAGEAVARWGGVEQPATQEAAMLALAAAQEANATHWGIPQRVGELARMEQIAKIIAKRWPDHPQLEAIWMNLARLYDAFGRSEQAAETYARLPADSASYITAQLAAGNACWTAYRRGLPSEGEPPANQQPLRVSARKHLVAAVDKMQDKVREQLSNAASGLEPEPDEKAGPKSQKKQKTKSRDRRAMQKNASREPAAIAKPTKPLLNAKLTLARIDVLSGNIDGASNWLGGDPFPLTKSIAVKSPGPAQIVMPESFVRAVFETQFVVKSQMNDPAGAKAALQEMARILGGGGAVGGKMLGVAVDYVHGLQSSPKIGEKQIKTLEDLLAPLQKNAQSLTADNLVWISQSWSDIAERANSRGLRIKCYSKAADDLGRAIRRKDFPKGSLTSARLRQAQLLRSAGHLEASLAVIDDVLKETPNIFQLQIEAASALEQLAIDEINPPGLADAIEGPGDTAIWGWSKLVSALHGVRYSSNGTEQHAKQLLQCQYHLAKCRWLLARATVNPTDQSRSIASVSRTLNRLVMTTPEDQQPWSGRLRRLHAAASE